MKILVFFFGLYFYSSFSFALTGSVCTYHSTTGVTTCALPGGDVEEELSTMIICGEGSEPLGDSCYYICPPGTVRQSDYSCRVSGATCPLSSYWDGSACQAVPVCKTDEYISMGACKKNEEVKVEDSQVDPNPSKDDVACDPTKPPDPAHPELGCVSQETAIKSNELQSEANSKLGSIANSSATSTDLLSDIKGILNRLASSAFGGGSSGDGSGDGSNDGSDNNSNDGSDNGSSDLLTDNVQLSDGSPLMSGSGSCPSAESFDVLGSNYSFSYEPLCNFAESIRGLVVAMGAFSALLLVVSAL